MRDIIQENRDYWTKRAATYSSDIRKDELTGDLRDKWFETVDGLIAERFAGADRAEISVLDIGTGPGFFSIILADAGYQVTAIDLTPSMLAEARENAGPLAERIRFIEMNAERLTFEDASFDVIVTRNLTWDLPHPKEAYKEWHRVLRPDGLLLNFDANWYRYLFDEDAKAAYDVDRINAGSIGITNDNPDVDYGIMEEIATRVPLSHILRPSWDIDYLTSLGFHAKADEGVWETLWSDEDKINFASTPLFLIHAVKSQ